MLKITCIGLQKNGQNSYIIANQSFACSVAMVSSMWDVLKVKDLLLSIKCQQLNMVLAIKWFGNVSFMILLVHFIVSKA